MARGNKMYVITDSTLCDIYTPELFLNKDEAVESFQEHVIEEIFGRWDLEILEIMREKISNAISEIKNEITAYAARVEELYDVHNDLSNEEYDKQEDELVEKGKKIAEKFDELMKKDSIPIGFDDSIDYSEDFRDFFCSMISMEFDEYDMKSMIEGHEVEFIKFVADNIESGCIQYSDTQVLLDYGNDSFNLISLFELEPK